MKEPPADISPASHKRIAATQGAAGHAATAAAALPPASAHVDQARAAVTPPSAEAAAKAEADLVVALGQRPKPSPEIEELCKQIYAIIASKTPDDEPSLIKTDPEAMARDAGNQLQGNVQGDVNRVDQSYSPLDQKPSGNPAQPGKPIEPPSGAAPTPPIDAEKATPDPVPAQDASLDADAADTKAKADQAGMDTEPAKLVKTGPVAEARDAQGELEQTAKEDPAKVMAQQQATLAKAGADMAALQKSAMDALAGSRHATVSGTGSQQHHMVGSEESMRTQASAQAQAIFTDAQNKVSALLQPLAPTAKAKWDAGVAISSSKFKQALKEVEDWLKERHSGGWGSVVSVWDDITGLPSWVTDKYKAAETAFGNEICDTARQISAEVNGVIMACEAIIADARTKISSVFSSLPASLQSWAAGEQAKFGAQLDGLTHHAHEVQTNFTRDLVKSATQSFQDVRDQLHALREKAKGLVGRVLDAIDRFSKDPAKFILEGILEILGIPPSAFWAVVAKIQKAVKDIADDPMKFANNLMKAVGQGFNQFFDHILSHLLKGFIDWLTGGLASAGVTLPKDASVKSIVTFILQLMGITWPRIRKLLAKHIGEENVALIEKVYSIVANLIALGPEGVFEMIKEKLNPATILNQIINAAVDYMIKAVIKAVSARIILLFNPVGAILQALEAIYKVLKWIFVNAARIFRLVETIVNGIADIIAGSIGGLANAVESALGQLIAPVIDFLADYLGFGDLPDKVKDTIIGLQAWVESILDEVIGWLVAKGKELLKAIGLGGEDKDKKDGHDANVGEKVPFTADGKGHSLWVNVHGESAVLMVASDVPMTIEERLSAWSADAKNLPKGKTGEESPQAKAEKLIPQAESLLSATDKTAEDLIRTSHKSNEDEKESAPTSGEQAELSDEEHKLADILQQLFEIFGEHGSPPLVGTYGDLRARRKERPDNEVHHVPPKALLAWMKDVAEKARNDLSQSEIAKGIDFGWVTQLAQTHQSVYEPGNPLSSISVHRETHIKKSGEPTTDVWRIHWGAETAKAVFGRLKDKTVTAIVNGTPTKLSIVFIRRKLFADLSPEDQILAKELEKEAEETMPGSEVGTIPDAAGLVISTQFFKTELWSALREAQSQAEIDVGKLAENLGKVARGAAAIAQVAVEEALKASERDGSEDEKAAAVADLKQLSIEIWTKLPGVEGLNIL